MKTTIKLIALITAGQALYVLYPNVLYPTFGLQSIKFVWTSILHGSDVEPPIFIFLGFVATILPFLKLLASYGLFQLRSWSLNLAVGALSIDLLIRFIGAINFVIQVWEYRNKPVPAISKGAIVISLWPSYIIAFLCGISVLILLRPSSKRILKQTHESN